MTTRSVSRSRVLVLFTLLASGLAQAAGNPIQTALEQSRDGKHGLTLVVGGRDIALVVTEISGEFVIGKSQQHEQIVVRIDRIDAALK